MKHLFFVDLRKFPNLLCIYRLVAIIVSVLLFVFAGLPVIAALLGLTAGLTDYWDGIYARKHNMVTKLGALLDQISDLMFNFFVISAAVYMGVWGVWGIWILFLWGFRDLAVLSMRASAGQLGFIIPSSYLGKLASNFIFYGLFLMPIDYALNSPDYMFHEFVEAHIHPYIGLGVHWIAILGGMIPGIIMQYISAYSYAKSYIQQYDEIHKREEEAADPDLKKETEAAEAELSAELSDH